MLGGVTWRWLPIEPGFDLQRGFANAQSETVSVPFKVRALTLGNFIWDRDGRTYQTEGLEVSYSASVSAIVVSKALAFCRESSRVCCTTIETSDSITLA